MERQREFTHAMWETIQTNFESEQLTASQRVNIIQDLIHHMATVKQDLPLQTADYIRITIEEGMGRFNLASVNEIIQPPDIPQVQAIKKVFLQDGFTTSLREGMVLALIHTMVSRRELTDHQSQYMIDSIVGEMTPSLVGMKVDITTLRGRQS